MRQLMAIAAVYTATTAAAFAADPLPFDPEMVKDMPKDVADFIDDEGLCAHFSGEEPYDDARRKEINDAIADLRCDTLDAREVALQKQYQGDKKVLKRMKKAHNEYR